MNKPAVSIETGVLSVNDLVKVLETRGVVKSATESRADLEKALATTTTGSALSVDELMVLSKNSITGILDNKKIAFTTGENKTQLIRKLF